MQFKVPPVNLALLTGLWILLGGAASYFGFADGDNFIGGVGLFFCLAGILVWFNFRPVVWPLMIWFSFVILGSLLLLALKGVTLRPFTVIAMAGYTIYELNQWRQLE